MKKSVPLFVGLRYVRAKRRNHFISFISLFSIIGIMLGVMVLIIVLSVMNGFEAEIKNRLLSMESHITLSGFGTDWKDTIAKAKKHPDVTGAAPYIQGFGLINKGRLSSGVFIRGINPDREHEVSDIGRKMVYGSMEDLKKTRFGVVLGNEVARRLLGFDYDLMVQSFWFKQVNKIPLGKIMVRDIVTALYDKATYQRLIKTVYRPDHRVMVVSPNFRIGPAGMIPRFKRFKVVGIFRIDMKDYDTNMIVMNIRDAAKLLQIYDGVSAVQLRLKDSFKATRIKQELGEKGYAWHIRTWFENHRNLFSAIANEKRMMFFILLILVIVAAINIVSTLVMVVTDKEADIAILRTLGASPTNIRNIFIVQGVIIGSIGTFLGVASGVAISENLNAIINWLENLFGFQAMSAEVYYISELVGKVHWNEVALIAACSFFITLLATLYPARRAARTQPAQALRYE